MTTLTLTELSPFLVSELPPAAPWQGKPSRLAARRAARRFERALRAATAQERSDLLAQARAQRTVTDTLS